MKTVENGNNVMLHYKGTFPDGEEFDNSRNHGKAMEVNVGAGQLLEEFEKALVGMTEGEVRNISLTADEAYGQPIEEAIVTVPLQAFPEDFKFEEGLVVSGQGPSGETVRAKILTFDEEKVILDHNHPLAGKDINFEIELVEIANTATAE
jgi:peptidylprolyl isomerase